MPGRNDPCWCGSGGKFKKCHLERHRQPPFTKQELLRRNVLVMRRSQCLHSAAPGACAGPIVRAHTIQRARNLEKLARKKHVYTFRSDLMPMLNGEVFAPRLTGVRVASTFTGFCSRHDTEQFRPLESAPFTGTPEQCLLLTYRACCRELYAKQGTLALADTLRELDRGRPYAAQRETQDRMDAVLRGSELAIGELLALKEEIEASLAAASFDTVHAYVVFFGSVPDVMVTAMLNPEYDFGGKRLQSLAAPGPLEWLSFSLLATDTGGAAVFAWMGPSPVAEQLTDSLHSIADEEVSDAIVRFAFEMSEDVCASPDWWEGLDDIARARIVDRMETGGNPVRLPTALQDDGLRVARWGVVSRVRF